MRRGCGRKNAPGCSRRSNVFAVEAGLEAREEAKLREAGTTEAREDCRSLAQIIDRIGDKWTVMVVGHLSEGTRRFNELMRLIPGVSHRMLTLTLRGLERDGLVRRTAYPTIPPRVEYTLTPLGAALTGPLSILAEWARLNRAEIERARERYDGED